jgi:hypothetical protein
MERLEKNLNSIDYETYKNIKSSILNKYPTYHRNFKFSKAKSLVTYVDSILNKYASILQEDDFNVVADPIERKITNISSIATSEKDAEILAKVMMDFISNSEAALTNGMLKFMAYAMMYTSEVSTVLLSSRGVLASIVGEQVVARTNQEIVNFFDSLIVQAYSALNIKAADMLYSILTSCFSYTRNLVVLFSQKFSEDRRLNGLFYKQSMASIQSLMRSLSQVFISDFFSTAVRYFNYFSDFASNYYVSYLNDEIFNTVKGTINNIYRNNTFSFESSEQKIINNFADEVADASKSIIPNMIAFNVFVDEANDEFFILSKKDFKLSMFYAIKGV